MQVASVACFLMFVVVWPCYMFSTIKAFLGDPGLKDNWYVERQLFEARFGFLYTKYDKDYW